MTSLQVEVASRQAMISREIWQCHPAFGERPRLGSQWSCNHDMRPHRFHHLERASATSNTTVKSSVALWSTQTRRLPTGVNMIEDDVWESHPKSTKCSIQTGHAFGLKRHFNRPAHISPRFPLVHFDLCRGMHGYLRPSWPLALMDEVSAFSLGDEGAISSISP